mgnify:CR=1 FL=1
MSEEKVPTFVLISEDEAYWTEILGAKFKYRRISPIKASELEEQCTTKGVVNNTKLYLAMLEYCLLDWKDVRGNVNGEIVDLPFDKKYFPGLPNRVILQLVSKFTNAFVEVERELKNSKSTSRTLGQE